MILYLAGVGTGFFLIGCYGACVRAWENESVAKWKMKDDFSGRVVPWYVRAWFFLFE